VDYRLLFTQRALDDLSEIVGHIAQDDDETASCFDEALLDHVDLLGRFPRMGNATGRRSRVRKLVQSPILVTTKSRRSVWLRFFIFAMGRASRRNSKGPIPSRKRDNDAPRMLNIASELLVRLSEQMGRVRFAVAAERRGGARGELRSTAGQAKAKLKHALPLFQTLMQSAR
jgi:plasmid stabilization system protein ParE